MFPPAVIVPVAAAGKLPVPSRKPETDFPQRDTVWQCPSALSLRSWAQLARMILSEGKSQCDSGRMEGDSEIDISSMEQEKCDGER